MLRKMTSSKAFVIVFCFFWVNAVFAEADPWQMNMFKGVTPVSRDMYNLHMIGMLVCAIIGLVVFGIMIYSLIHHRKSKGYQAAKFHDNTRLEIVWTIIPFLILLGLAFPATRTLIKLDNVDRSQITIKVVGSQWKWEYFYLDEGLHFYSNLATPFAQIENKQPKGSDYLSTVDKEIVVPVDKKIRFLVTSRDVIHSWWVPELGIKRDAMPGFMYEAWALIQKPGIYHGQCTELCGVGHAYMPIVVRAVPMEEYQQWVSQQLAEEKAWKEQQNNMNGQKTLTRDELMKLGKEKYNMVCAACHQVSGKGIPPMYPALKGSSIAVGYPIDRHINMLLIGSPGSAMQSYADMFSNEEIAAIITYVRNAWENNTNDIVQPLDIAKLRVETNKKPTVVEKTNVGGLK